MFDMDTHITPGMITVDCTDARALAHFWSEATGAPIIMDYEGYFVMVGTTPTLGFQRVDDPTPGKNRVHIEFRSHRTLDHQFFQLWNLRGFSSV